MATKQAQKETQNDQEIVIPISSLVTQNSIVEQVWSEGRPALQIHTLKKSKPDEITYAIQSKDDLGNLIKFIPIDNEHLRKGSVIIPEANTDLETASFETLWELQDQLLDAAFDTVNQREEAQLQMRLSTSSWFLDKEESGIASMGKFAPILAIRGPSGGGKGRFANILRFCSYHCFHQTSTNKIPSIYRPLEFWKGSLSLNECDLDAKKDKDLVAFLLARSYGDPISRQNPNNVNESNAFNNFGMTIAVQRENFGENALEGRTIPFYCEKSWEKLPTLETPEMIELGKQIQSLSLALRMKYYNLIQIDKKYWLDTSDARLNSALLPLVSISQFDPSVKILVNRLLKKIERRKTALKAQSDDGLLINYIYEKVTEKNEDSPHRKLFESYLDGKAFYLLYKNETITDKRTEAGSVMTEKEVKIPLTTSLIAADLGWSNPRGIRKRLDALLHVEDLPETIRVDGKKARVIFFRPAPLRKLCREFVVDFNEEKDLPVELKPKEGTLDEV
jgi:hypothetical protein